MMFVSENKDAMQRNYDASTRCIWNNTHFYTLRSNHANLENIPGNQDGHCALPSGNLVACDRSLSNEPLESSEEIKQDSIYNHDSGMWCAYPDPNAVQMGIFNAFQNQFNPSAINYNFQSQFPQNYQGDHYLQDFQYFVVIDFEATCEKDRKPFPQEIIEFPSVIVNGTTGQLEACFQTYVRPTCNQLLSDFCKDLTGIQQIQVDRGITLSEALLRHDKWLEKKGIKNTNFAVVTWSNWDCQVMLESECRIKKIRKPPYFNRWINLRVPFNEVFGAVRCNLKEAVEKAGLTWQGRAHSGLDDAKNTARLLALFMHNGFKFSITNSLPCQYIDYSFTLKPPEEKPSTISLQYQKLSELREKPSTISLQYQKLSELRASPLQYNACCYCGVTRSRGVIRKPGPKQGSLFFGCGNWTAARGARCLYFEWASP